jgi:Leucine-rich repeat (LRR) protein/tRNA A-37 threonylcarbamoyl transferase component Bud32
MMLGRQRGVAVDPVPQKNQSPPNFKGRFEVIDFLGEGGMGTVYKVREAKSNKSFAIKVLKDDLSHDALAVKRFEQEVRAAGELEHPNLVFIYGADKTNEGSPYMVMNYVEGANLAELIAARGSIAYPQALEIFVQIAKALVHAHAKQIIHRDLKPSNIIVSNDDQGHDHVRVVDFGIAKASPMGLKSTTGASSPADLLRASGTDLTQTGGIFGSPLYMSPEQFLGEKIDARSDIYSFGCVMFEALCGQPPFREENAAKTMMKHLHLPPPPLRSIRPTLKVPKELEKLVMVCLRKNPKNRYESAESLLSDLQALRAGGSVWKKAGGSAVLDRRWWPPLAFFSVLLGSLMAVIIFVIPLALYCWQNLPRSQASDTSSTEWSLERYLTPIDSALDSEEAIGKEIDLERNPIKYAIASHVRESDINVSQLAEGQVSDKDITPLQDAKDLACLDLSDSHITNAGLNVVRDKSLTKLSLNDCNVNDLKAVRSMASLRELRLSGAAINDQSLEAVSRLSGLVRLSLNYTSITDSCLPSLYSLSNLEQLSLLGCKKISITAIKELEAKLPCCRVSYCRYSGLSDPTIDVPRDINMSELANQRLAAYVKGQPTYLNAVYPDATYLDVAKMIAVSGTMPALPGLTDDGLKVLEKATDLQTLILADQSVSDRGLHALRGLKLVELSLSGTNAKSLDYLKGQKNLKRLYLDGLRLNASAFDVLASLANLESLSLYGTNVNAKDLEKLYVLKHLRMVSIGDCRKLSVSAGQALRSAIPQCQINDLPLPVSWEEK